MATRCRNHQPQNQNRAPLDADPSGNGIFATHSSPAGLVVESLILVAITGEQSGIVSDYFIV